MGELEPGTLVKTLRTDRDTFRQWGDMSGVVARRDEGAEYESYFVSWGGYPGEVMMRDEVEPLSGSEKLALLASQVMES